MLYIGIDPDMHTMAIAAVSIHLDSPTPKPLPIGGWIVKSGGLTGRAAILAMNEAMVHFLSKTPLHVDEQNFAWNPCFVVEHQNITYTARSGKNPQNILNLSTVSGLVIGMLKMLYPHAHILLPEPKAWKGQRKKHVDQADTYAKFGWGAEIRATGDNRYAVPTNTDVFNRFGERKLNMSDWKHLGDGFGLAMHGVKQPWSK